MSNTADSYWSQYNKAQQLIEKHDYQKTLDILKALASEQQNFHVYLLIAETYEAQLQPKQALIYYEKALQLANLPGPERYQVRALFGLARTELALKNARVARKYYKKLLTYDLAASDRALVNKNLEYSYPIYKNQQRQELIKTIENHIEQGDGKKAYSLVLPLLEKPSAKIYLLAGHGKALQEEPEAALDCYQKSLQMAQKENNNTLERVALFAIARMQIILKKPGQAKQTYRLLKTMQLSQKEQDEIATGYKKIAELKTQLAFDHVRTILEKGEAKKAYQLIQPMLHQPSLDGYLLAGDIFAARDKPEHAIQYYQKTLNLAKKKNDQTYEIISLFAIARMHLALRDAEHAKSVYLHLLSLPINKNQLATATAGIERAKLIEQETLLQKEIMTIEKLVEQSRGREALRRIKQLLSEKHESTTIFILAGASYALQNYPVSARNFYQKAVIYAKKENNKNLLRIALFGLARTQLKLQHTKESKKTYMQILAMNLSKKDNLLAQEGLLKVRKIALRNIIQRSIKKDSKLKAYHLLLEYVKRYQQPRELMFAAKMMLNLEKPKQAILLYEAAYQKALSEQDRNDQRQALIGLSETHMALDHYVRATSVFNKLLRNYPLTPQEYENAKAGLVKSYAYRGWNYAAFNAVPWDMEFTSVHMVIAALQTSLWIERGDMTQELYTKYADILKTIRTGSYLERDLKNIDWLLCLTTAPYQIKPEIYHFQDNEGFNIQKSSIQARRYWSQNWMSFATLTHLKYSQLGEQIKGPSIKLRQLWRPSRFFEADVAIAPTRLTNWRPTLWNVSTSVTPNDLISFRGGIDKEILEGFTAIQNSNTYNNYHGGATLQPFPYVRLDGTIYELKINDSNRRTGFNFDGTVTLMPTRGIYGGYRIRDYSSAFQSPFYFSPDHYNQSLFILGIGQRIFETWRYFAEGGYGKQTIKPSPDVAKGSGPSWFYRGGIRGPISRCIYFDIAYGKYNQASAFVDAENYASQDILASLIFSFD